jgi:sensor histidine kinase regulating citrate/malate metabolism
MDILLQIVGFVAIAYVLLKYFPAILGAVFKLSVIVIALLMIALAVSVYMSDWIWSVNYA